MATPSHAAVERHPVASSPHDAGATATCRSRGTPVWRDPRQGPAQEDDTPTEVRTSAACRPTPRALSPPPVSPSGVVPGVASPTPVSRSSGSSLHQGESGTAWGEGHAWARGAWGEPQVWSPSHELCAHLPAEPGGRGPPPCMAPGDSPTPAEPLLEPWGARFSISPPPITLAPVPYPRATLL